MPSAYDVAALLTVLEVGAAKRSEILELLDRANEPDPELPGQIARELAAVAPGSGSVVRCVLKTLAAHCDPTEEMSATVLNADDLRAIADHVPCD